MSQKHFTDDLYLRDQADAEVCDRIRTDQPARRANPPAIIPPPLPRHRFPRVLILVMTLLTAGGIGYWWWSSTRPLVPAGIVWSNGRLEADEVEIDTKFAGRVLELRADEGDMVKAGEVIAVMDTRDLQALLRQYTEVVQQNERILEQTKKTFASQQAVVKLARQEVARTAFLVPKGFATQQTLDQQTQQLNSALAVLDGHDRAVEAAQHALEAARHQVEYYAIQIADNQLFAPKTGPIEYRIANVGEVLPAGGKVFTMLDSSYVYMDIYLPTVQAGRVRIGSEARIMLDAYPDHIIPAKVVFVASHAQFTPKMVETKDERDKLMFRIRVRIDPDRLAGQEALVRSGLPGDAFVRTDDAAAWPARLAPSLPPAATNAASR